MAEQQMDLFKRPANDEERRAIGLYAVLARDFMDFLEMVSEEESNQTLRVLYLMLTTPNPKQSESDTKLNALGAGPVERELKKRGLELPTVETL